jgi:predicted acyl esterase
VLLAWGLAAGAGAQARAGDKPATPRPLGLRCVTQADHVRFCQGNGTTDRVPSWDGTPLDADVTLPPTGKGPYPTIVMLHGWGNDKTGFESTDEIGKGYNAGAGLYKPPTYHYNTDYYARQGYAVLTYSARGKGASCGGGGAPRAQLQTGPCGTGFIRLADQRYEVRDTQYLLGLLVDQRISAPGRIGVTGISYGGGQSLELAYLKDRIRCSGESRPHDPCSGRPADSFVRWTSPRGVPLSITASHPRWFWSDLVSALMPNGRFLDFRSGTAGSSRDPIGVEIASFLNGLLATGDANGYYVTPQPPGGAYEPWDLTAYGATFDAGEPYGTRARGILDEIFTHHQGYGIPGRSPSPLLLESGWNDALFPAEQALRVYTDLRAKDPRAPVSLFFGDVGHSAGSNKQTVNQVFNDRTAAFFAHYLKGAPGAVADGSVTALTTTCPATVRDGGPYRAASWDALHPGAVELVGAAAQTVLSAAGNPMTGAQFDAIANSDTCRTVQAETVPGTASYTLTSAGFTLMGLPTVSADVVTTGSNGQLVARLWDVRPDGRQLLVSRGVYRLLDNQSGRVVLQLHGNGYRFAPGDTVKLELLGTDTPYYRASNGVFAVTVSNLRASLPVLEAPGSRGQVRANPYRGRRAG